MPTNILKPEILGRRPLVSFERSVRGQGQRRASLEKTSGGVFMPPLTRSRASSSRRRRTSSKKVRLVNGRIRLRVPGYTGLQSLSPAHLVRHIGVSKLRLAAKKVLRLTKRASGGPKRRKKTRRGKKAGKKGKKGKKRRRRKAQKGRKSSRKRVRRKKRKATRRKRRRRTVL